MLLINSTTQYIIIMILLLIYLLQTVKKAGGAPGEMIEVEEMVEIPYGEGDVQDQISLDLMESQITREEVSRNWFPKRTNSQIARAVRCCTESKFEYSRWKAT